MRGPRKEKELIRLYKLSRTGAILVGIVLLGYGTWLLVSSRLSDPSSLSSWFGIFPIYLGAMLLIVAAAMREDWFTNVRRYW